VRAIFQKKAPHRFLPPWTGRRAGSRAGVLRRPLVMNREKTGALFILALSIGYCVLAFKIPLIFLSQGEALNARTMPYALSIAGIVLSLLILILPGLEKEKVVTAQAALKGLDWKRAAWLTGLMIVYSLAMPWIGFVIASIVFLAGGFLVLGERNLKVILIASIPMVLVLWFLLSKVLGMYIAPGELFYLLGMVQ
jgi:putative tricarboxylic transport membrane protein